MPPITHRQAVRQAMPWIYSGALHLVLVLLLLDLTLYAPQRDPPPTRIAIALITHDGDDAGELGESLEPEEPEQPEPEEDLESEPEEQLSEADTAPMAPQPDPEVQQPSPPTLEELEQLFGVGGRTVPMDGPENARSDPQARALFEALLQRPTPRRGVPELYGSRTAAGRRAGLAAHGGTPGCESAVEDGLAWLAAHQEPDGSWSAAGFMDRCPRGQDPCTGPGYRAYDLGVTGLVLLAFLGAGYHHRGTGVDPGEPGHYAPVIGTCLAHLRESQQGDGSFGGRSANMYNQALVTLSLAEAYALSGDPALVSPLRRAVDYLLRAQEPRGGWNYTPHPTRERNDVSITGWVVMALHGARVAGLHVPEAPFHRARRLLAAMTSPDGSVSYADSGQLAFRESRGLIPVSLFMSQLLGQEVSAGVTRRQLATLRAHPPSWEGFTTIHGSMYYCYYGTLATFLQGGEDWEAWNQDLQRALLPHQRRTGHLEGSWDPVGKWAQHHGGRLYSTALCVLNLEIYYKYQPSYLRRLQPPVEAGERYPGLQPGGQARELPPDTDRRR